MEILRFAILGIIQGLTEFLPVSSSGHLSLFQHIFNLASTIDNHFLNVMLHLGTMIAIIIVYREKIWNLIKEFFSIPYNIKKDGLKETFSRTNTNFILAIIIGTIPTGIIGFYLRDWVKIFETNLLIIAFMFLFTAIVLFLSRLFEKTKGQNYEKISILQALLIGIFQGIAVIPGISRSGITIGAGVGLKLKRETAASFSFILSLPAIIGATILEFVNIDFSKINIEGTILAFILALVIGWISLKFLLGFIRKGKFFYFGFYVLVISIITFIISLVAV